MEDGLLPVENADRSDLTTRAKSLLQDKENGAWLAVIDDACLDISSSSDEEESFWQQVDKAIPICSHGTLLVTSRKRPKQGFRDYHTIEVGEMTLEESDVFVRRLAPGDTKDEIAALTRRKERTPWALMEAMVNRKFGIHTIPTSLWRCRMIR